MTTSKAREKRIADALHAYSEKAGPKETLTLEWRGGHQEVLPVIELPLDTLLLYSHSHRFRAQLEGHPDKDVVHSDPWGDDAQRIVGDLLKTAHRDFDALKANLRDEGQRDAGIATRQGILINANSRTVALRELEQDVGGKRWLRVAILPADVDERELAELELRLQVQKELKDPYTLTNELLFIEDLTRNYGESSEQIALDLRWATNEPRSRKKWAAEVEQRLRILSLIREMQDIPSDPIPLTFFDDKLEQLKALENKYTAMIREDPDGARAFRDNWLCTARAGSSSVHDLRAVDQDFVEDFLRPRLEEDPLIGKYVGDLLAPVKERGRKDPPGVALLDPGGPGTQARVGVRRVLDVFSSDAKVSFHLPDGKRMTFNAVDVQGAVRMATKAAIQDFKAEGRTRNRLDEPIALVREAVGRLKKAKTKYNDVAKGLGQGRRGKFEYQVAQAKKAVAELDKLLQKAATTPSKKRPK